MKDMIRLEKHMPIRVSHRAAFKSQHLSPVRMREQRRIEIGEQRERQPFEAADDHSV
jgi:hypothetical protein